MICETEGCCEKGNYAMVGLMMKVENLLNQMAPNRGMDKICRNTFLNKQRDRVGGNNLS